MRLFYLETAKPGLSWFRQYHRERPELNWTAAHASQKAAITTIKDNPYSGHPFDGRERVFERKILRTSFSLLYTIHDETIYVIDVRDQRGFRSAAALKIFTAELRRKYGLDG